VADGWHARRGSIEAWDSECQTWVTYSVKQVTDPVSTTPRRAIAMGGVGPRPRNAAEKVQDASESRWPRS